ncbi:MAG: Ig-like domain-containing protein, partial [Thermoplasmata archaeon]|nr:Ig-like domain-containing protein [Thermoplasmata archaeon]
SQGFRDLATQSDVTIYGAEQGDNAGYSVATGDVNGDNTDDIIIGALTVSGFGRSDCGVVYVIYGNGSLSSVIDLNTSVGGQGPDVTIYGQEDFDQAGYAVASGDVSGDSKDDIILSAINAFGPNSTRFLCGEVYIINGKPSLPAIIDLNTTGIGPDTIIYGTDEFDQAGWSIATGNIYGSSKEDLIIGAPFAYGPNNTKTECGEVYLIYGSSTLASSIDLNTTTPGTHADVIIYGIDGETLMSMGDHAGFAVAAGDVCSDNKDDIIIGAPCAGGPDNNRLECGEVYIINGSSFLPDTIDLNTSVPGGVEPDILIYGAEISDAVGSPIEAGNLNKDTKEEIIICAPYAPSGPNKNRQSAGEVYIINGSISLPPTIDFNTTTATPNHNVTIWGANVTDYAGTSIASGDINGDTIEELIIGAPNADGIDKNKPDSGEIYILGILEPNLNPWIKITVPSNGMTGVALNASIIVNFSEPMSQLGFTTSNFSCSPDPGGWSINWNLNGDGVNVTHNQFSEKTIYNFEIIAITDLTGKSLIQHPNLLIPNPWNFTTGDFTNPMVTRTTPAHNASKVKLDEGIEIRFSEPMNTTTLKFTCEPDPGGWQTPIWNATNETVIYNHTNPFQELTGYWFNLTAGNDTWDWPLVPNPDPKIPNSIRFWTGGFTSPKILTIVPANNTINVEVNASIIVTFSEPMNASTLTLNCQPVVLSGFSPQWNANNDQLTYTHSDDFAYNTWYNITISGAKDLAGNDLIEGLEPNPWRFRTEGLRPKIIMTDPVNNSKNVPLNKDIIITFSKPMNNVSITYTCDPMPSGGFSGHWNPNNTKVTYQHAIDFDKITTYKFRIITGSDINDNELILDINNPLIFKTVGDNPIILETTPANDANNIYSYSDIKVKFSETMDVDTVKFKCTADPGGWKTP